MSNKHKLRKPEKNLDGWILDYLLTGDCTPRIKAYLWNTSLGGCLCNVYGPLWESIRGKVLPQWRKEHPDGELPWAEMKRLEKNR